MPGDCPAVAAPAAGSPVENIPLQAERYSGGGQEVFSFSPERCSPSDRNAVRDHNGMVFGFTPESRSPSTGFCIALRSFANVWSVSLLNINPPQFLVGATLLDHGSVVHFLCMDRLKGKKVQE
jgi:hypothetical protein